ADVRPARPAPLTPAAVRPAPAVLPARPGGRTPGDPAAVQAMGRSEAGPAGSAPRRPARMTDWPHGRAHFRTIRSARLGDRTRYLATRRRLGRRGRQAGPRGPGGRRRVRSEEHT